MGSRNPLFFQCILILSSLFGFKLALSAKLHPRFSSSPSGAFGKVPGIIDRPDCRSHPDYPGAAGELGR
jgi:hypothetical protein